LPEEPLINSFAPTVGAESRGTTEDAKHPEHTENSEKLKAHTKKGRKAEVHEE
jgi:hypothetical protein